MKTSRICLAALLSTILSAVQSFAQADAVLVDDTLEDAAHCSGARQGGSFVSGGWKSTSWSDRIVYDLGRPVDCGKAELEITNLDPINEYEHGGNTFKQEAIVMLISAWQGDHGNQHVAGPGCETHFWVQVTCDRCNGSTGNLDKKFVLKGLPMGWSDQCPHCSPEPRPFDITSPMEWDTSIVYKLVLSWSRKGVDLSITQPTAQRYAKLDFCWPDSDGSPAIRYIFLARPGEKDTGFLNGPIYSNFKVIDCTSRPEESRVEFEAEVEKELSEYTEVPNDAESYAEDLVDLHLDSRKEKFGESDSSSCDEGQDVQVDGEYREEARLKERGDESGIAQNGKDKASCGCGTSGRTSGIAAWILVFTALLPHVLCRRYSA